MHERAAQVKRTTKETDIDLSVDFESAADIRVSLGLPFFEHILTSMAFHGGFGLRIAGKGDLEVDPHHLVEDCGIVLGDALTKILTQVGSVNRYGSAIIPMDDALSEAIVDVCRRPYLVYRVEFPQEYAGSFHLPLLREFFQGLANRAQINLHACCRYGINGHHMAESLFKATGKALAQAYALPTTGESSMSTKGTL